VSVIVVAGINHRSVPLPLLERMAVPPARLPKALHDLASRDHIAEVVLLSTCLRTEVYAVANRFHGAVSDIRNFLEEWSGIPPESFSDFLYSYYDEAAVEHLFKVASGLDSAVLGEGEVLGQVGDAWEAAWAEGTTGSALAVLFRHAVEAGKRVRTETAISRGTTSLSQAAVAMAVDRLGTLAGKTVLVIGAGGMAESMAQALSGAGERLVANRTLSRARELAERCGGTAVRWKDLPTALVRADLVLTSTASPESLLDVGDLEPLLCERAGRPLLVVDIAVPRDVDPSVGTLPGVTLLDIEDLSSYAKRALTGRRGEVPRAEAIVAEEVTRYLETANQRQLAPLVAALHQRAEEVRARELARYERRLRSMNPPERQVVEALTKAVVAKLLHPPTMAVKASAGTPSGERLAEALRQLFDLQ
jgi:glutamyl-tRNA reductase